MIVLKVKDEESDDESLLMPELMNYARDIYSDDGDTSSDESFELTLDSSSNSSSEVDSCDEANEMDQSNILTNDFIPNSCPSSVQSSLSENDFDSEEDGLELFPAYHLPNNMDISDDEETAIARNFLYPFIVALFRPSNRDAESEEKAVGTGSTSDNGERSKSPDKDDATSCETTANKSTALDA